MAERPLRLFFGLPLPPDLQAALGRWQQAQPPTRWSRPEGLHLTLAFLGERPAAVLARLHEVAAPLALHQSAFPLRTAALGGFPEGPAARVLWLGLDPSAALAALAADLRRALALAEEPFDAKPFWAHITLARPRHPLPPASFTTPPPAQFAATHLVLFESQSGGVYAPLRSWPLRGV